MTTDVENHIIRNCKELHSNKYNQYDWKGCNKYWRKETDSKSIIHEVYSDYCIEYICEKNFLTMQTILIDEDFNIRRGIVWKILDGPPGTINKYLSMDWETDIGIGGVKSVFKSKNCITTVSKKEFLSFIRDTLYIKKGQIDMMLRKYEKMEQEIF